MGGAVFGVQVNDGVYEGDVGQGLGEIAHETAKIGVVFLGQKTEVVADAEEFMEEALGGSGASG